MEFDKDLRSIQEVRDLVARAKAAQAEYAAFSQEQVDHLVEAVATACAAQAERLAKMAVEETGCGVDVYKRQSQAKPPGKKTPPLCWKSSAALRENLWCPLPGRTWSPSLPARAAARFSSAWTAAARP